MQVFVATKAHVGGVAPPAECMDEVFLVIRPQSARSGSGFIQTLNARAVSTAIG